MQLEVPASKPLLASSPGQSLPLGLTCVFALGWLGYALLSVPAGFVHEDPAEIAMWAEMGFHWGYAKHPPLLPWIVLALGWVVPITWVTLAVLSAANLTLAAWAVWRLALVMVGPERAAVAVGLFCLSPYTTTQAIKLNHNSILLSLWPLTVLAFLNLYRQPSVANGVILGVVSALAVLAKYSSGLLLVGLALATLAGARRMALLTAPATYIAMAVFAVLLTPHVSWMVADNFKTIDHATQSLAPVGALPLAMIAANVSALAPMLVGATLLVAWLGRARPGLYHSEIAVIAATVYALSIAIVAALGLRGSHTWTLPVFAFIPLLLAGWIRAPAPEQAVQLRRLSTSVLLALPLIGLGVQIVSFKRATVSAVDPQIEFAHMGARVWARTVGVPIQMVAGDHRYAMAASLVLPGRPPAWPLFHELWWAPKSRIDVTGALAWCRDDGDKTCDEIARKWVEATKGWSCPLTHQRKALGMTGPMIRATLYIIPPLGAVIAGDREDRCKFE
jgi:Dolichyl-phosphate-mannose-protein mannosyltransferase